MYLRMVSTTVSKHKTDISTMLRLRLLELLFLLIIFIQYNRHSPYGI